MSTSYTNGQTTLQEVLTAELQRNPRIVGFCLKYKFDKEQNAWSVKSEEFEFRLEDNNKQP